jgi:hypothetical protein
MVDDTVSIADNLIELSDPDKPIYRIFPIWALEEALRLRRITLMQPIAWDDPFEIVGDAIAVNRPHSGQKIINQDLPPVFAQCWSATAESDTLLRAYSRVEKDPRFKRNISARYEGVQVKSTPRKLLQALQVQSFSSSGNAYVGTVQYWSRNHILQWIANTIQKNGLDAFCVPATRATLLLLKRTAFQHESEVRLLFVCNQVGYPEIFRHIEDIDPNEVFEEISFDPRLERFEAEERKSTIRSLGYSGTIANSELYHRTLLEVNLNES